jgi:hypothetical protein
VTPRKLTTRPVDRAWAAGRRRIAEKYAEVAHLVEVEDGEAVNVCVGLCVLAGIAAGDAICAAATGQRYAGQDHAAAADYLATVDRAAGGHLRTLVGLKPGAHYGNALLSANDRKVALRAVDALVDLAGAKTGVTRGRQPP